MPEKTVQPEQAPQADATVDAWFKEWFHNSGLAVPTEQFNRWREATEDLKRRLSDTPITKEE